MHKLEAAIAKSLKLEGKRASAKEVARGKEKPTT